MSNKFDRFSRQARQVLTTAQEEAQLLRHGYIGTEHLLLGLLREEECLPAQALQESGVNLTKTRAMIGEMVNKPKTGPFGQISLTPNSKRALELAVEEARRLGHTSVGAEHLLLGLLRQTDDVAITILRAMGVDIKALRAQVEQATPPKTPKPAAPVQPEGALAALTLYFQATYISAEESDAQKALTAMLELLTLVMNSQQVDAATKQHVGYALIALADKAETAQRHRLMLKGTLDAIHAAIMNADDISLDAMQIIADIQHRLKLS